MKSLLLLLVLSLGCLAGSPEPSPTGLVREAERIGHAHGVVVQEFVGYQHAEPRVLRKMELAAKDITALCAILTGPEFAKEPVPAEDDSYDCFYPHHSLVVTFEAGEPWRIDLCLQCQKIYFPLTATTGRMWHFSWRGAERLKELFVSLHLPPRTADEYRELEPEKVVEVTTGDAVFVQKKSGGEAMIQLTSIGNEKAAYRWRYRAPPTAALVEGIGQVSGTNDEDRHVKQADGTYKLVTADRPEGLIVRAGDIRLNWSHKDGHSSWLEYDSTLAKVTVCPGKEYATRP